MSCRFEKDDSIIRQLKVHVVDKGWLKIEFYNSKEQKAESKLCKLEMDLPPRKRDIEVRVLSGKKQYCKDVVLTSVSKQNKLD